MMKQVQIQNRPCANNEVVTDDGLVLQEAVQEEPHRTLRFDRMKGPSSFGGVPRGGAGSQRTSSSASEAAPRWPS